MEIAQNRNSMEQMEKMNTKRYSTKETTRTDKIGSSSSFFAVLSRLPAIYVKKQKRTRQFKEVNKNLGAFMRKRVDPIETIAYFHCIG